ncbi:isochorismatase hydrolase [Thermoclostridium stercorarium subsp. stercorarium DSM 8532]|jgi:nicotinamidase-related amidase|uniref:Isochorismatase hydrolase n=3 Tax=Thermoclostridium stercorarium TaxID=1510 RepID=L7VI23_THES1|nr:isochorismatase family cysteine hydrolase [Thermoclostridium stercorarium]AGC67670.1 isochorismatase hydrolase [Thermoclostridium stercorarium subsp. stercorarium DSM 8532]AGI38717.1 amidase [Thermoclostridium stercorarium subsp. stercorarium DSM 8532]ANW98087.1 isochorismatase [Thermoclostridium stercorarium subsp. thermolacticum DSM 2910]ANX00631.1 isochorismatase [Thermoclostridium stercorarium subsp. leptospartum DSM 9219]
MKILNREDFIRKSTDVLEKIVDMLEKLPSVKFSDLNAEQTALVIVDMINGFVREGALKSPRAEALIPEISRLSKACDELKITKLAFADSHTGESPEFDSYPEHCIRGTSESEVVDELKEVGGYILIPKNSTNGFHEEEFQKWLKRNEKINTFIVTGVCTDICVQQFAITLKTWFNMMNKKSRIIVPINTVDTYDLGVHNAELTHVMALYNMSTNGIELVSEIK